MSNLKALKSKLNLVITAIAITLTNITFGVNNCTFQNYKITNPQEAAIFLENKIGRNNLDSVISKKEAKIAIDFMTKEANIKSSDLDKIKNSKLYLDLVTAGQKYINSLLNNNLNNIPGYNWKTEYNNWLRTYYIKPENKNFLDILILNLIPKEKTNIEKIEKLEQLRKTFLKSIIAIQSYFYALSQTHMDEYTGFTEGTFSILNPYKESLEKLKNNYINIVLMILKIYNPTKNKGDLIGDPGVTAINIWGRGIFASNPYAYYRPNSHGFDDSIGIDLIGLEPSYKFNTKDKTKNFDWMYKFKHILMGKNKDQFWWKPEASGLGSLSDTITHGQDLIVHLWDRKYSPQKESGVGYAKERPIKSEGETFKKITNLDHKRISDIYLNAINLYKKNASGNKSKPLADFIKSLNKKYTYPSKRWGKEIILSTEDFITSYLNSNISIVLKQYIHYFIHVKRLLRQFQKHFNNNNAIKVILPQEAHYISALDSKDVLLTIIGHRIKLQSNNPIELIKEELRKLSCLTQALDTNLKAAFNNKTYNYLNRVMSEINETLAKDNVNNLIEYKHIFEVTK